MNEYDINSEICFSEFTSCDYNGFLDCINDFYRGGYPYPEYLDKQKILQTIDNGDMIVTIAKNREGRVVGTSAAKRLHGMFEGSVLLLLRSVVSDFQRRGIGSRQEYFLLEKTKEKFPETLSLYADVMTHDAVSQSTMVKQGFILCGLRMMLYKNEIICPTKAFAPGTKMTQAIYCKAYGDKKINIYVPPEQRNMVFEIYRELGVVCNVLSPTADEGDIRYGIHLNEQNQTSEVHIHYAGTGNADTLIKDLQKILDGHNTCVCYINMEQPGVCQIYERLKQLRFFFSGIKPLSVSGEYLVMSQIDNSVVHLEDIQYPPQAEKTVNYIFGGYKNEA